MTSLSNFREVKWRLRLFFLEQTSRQIAYIISQNPLEDLSARVICGFRGEKQKCKGDEKSCQIFTDI